MEPLSIKILGSRCASCRRLEFNVRKALEQLPIQASIVKVEDIEQILSYGVGRIPCLVINEQVFSQGKVHPVSELLTILKSYSQSANSGNSGETI